MEKEEILRKSRAEKKDEGVQHAWLTGTSWSFRGTTFIYAFIWFATFFIKEESLHQLQPLNILYFSSIGFQSLGEGVVSHRKLSIAIGILSLLLGIGHFILYFKRLIG